ncbi:MAG: CAP domain-containing protein [Deltaproteobacteria bacterium]|nr:CAP domain-containing protein [Deltaproteobacteria bacterium]
MTQRELNGLFLIVLVGLLCYGVISFNALSLWAQSTKRSPQPVLTSEQLLEERRKVNSIVNEEREKNRLAPLSWDDTLAAAAQKRAEELGILFDHNRPQGGDFSSIFDEYGINTNAAAENIANGQISASQAMASWMSSDGHRRNILNSSYRRMGVGAAYGPNGRLNWVQLFIK